MDHDAEAGAPKRFEFKKALILLICLVAAAYAGSVVILVLSREHTSPPPLPNPNGHDLFVKAGTALNGDTPEPVAGKEELHEYLKKNADALRLVREGLAQQCLIPPDLAATNISGVLEELASFKRVARLMVADARLAEMEGRVNDSIRIYLDTIQFGNEISRGGVIIGRLVGVACEALGAAGIVALAPRLDCEQAHATIIRLEEMDSHAVTWTQTLQNERRYVRHGWNNILNPINRLILLFTARSEIRRAEDNTDSRVARLRLLTVELALRCYRIEHGRGPARLEDLIPGQISRVPMDPFGEQPLIYRVTGTNWLLYSIGRDRVDDGGKGNTDRKSDKGDLFYDSPR